VVSEGKKIHTSRNNTFFTQKSHSESKSKEYYSKSDYFGKCSLRFCIKIENNYELGPRKITIISELRKSSAE